MHTEEGELEEADLFSDPEDDLHQRFSEVRRSLTLDSEGTEPDMQRASVLSKVAFFEMFQQGMETQSPSHSETLLRRSLIQEELEELASRPKRSSFPQEEEVRGEEEVLEEHECQLEFDDVFPAHREGDEEDVQLDEDIFDDEAEDEEESLVSVSETEDVLDFPDYDTRPEGLQDLEFEEVVCVTHEFSEEEQSAMEITDAYHEDISHEHPDITEEEDQPLGPTNLSTADESYRTDNFILCEDESPDLVENTPDNSREECFKSSEPDLNEQRDSFERTPDPEFCLMASKQENVEIRMKELSAKGGLSLVEVSEDASDESGDFNETMEGKLLENIVNNGRRYEPEYEKTPIEETCEASFREAVESEIDFEALFGKLHADWDVSEKANEGQESSKVIYPSETVQVLSRGRESERAAKLTQISPDLGPSPITDNDDDLEEEGKAGLEVTLDYQGTTSIPARDECFDESTQKDTIHVVWKSAKDPVEPQAQLVSPTPEDKAEQCYEALRRDYGQERAKALEETGLELNLVFSSSDEILPSEEHVEPLDYHQASKSSTASEPSEIVEHIDAETRQVVQSKMNFEDMFCSLDEENAEFADELSETDHFEDIVRESTSKIGNAPENFKEECFKSSEPDLNEQRDSFQRNLDPQICLMASKQENVEIRMKELSAKGGLSLVEVSEDASDESGDFNETMEGKLLENIVNNGRRYEPEYEKTPIEETCEASFREAVESEIDFEALFGKLHADWDVSEKANEGQESSKVIYPSETVQVLSRGRESERAAKLTQISPDLGPSPITDNDDDLEEEGKAGLEVTLDYQGTTSIPARDECFDESTQKDTIHVVWKSAKDPVEPQAQLVSPTPEDKAEQCYEALRRDYGQERAKALEETGLELNLVFSSSDEILPSEEHVEPLDYHQAPKSSTASEPPEILEHIDAETRQIVQSEINFEDMFRKEKRASPYMEENSYVDSVKYKVPEDSLHIAGETRSSEITEEVVEQHDDVQQTSLVMHEQTVGSVTTRSTSSPSVIAGDGAYGKSFEEMYEDVFDEVERRASLLEEEDSFLHEVEPITPSSPKHLVQEHQNVEPFEEIDEELIQESKRASLLLEEEKNKVNVQTDSPSSPKHIAVESRNFETYHELEEESIEECNRASSFLDEGTLVDEEITVLPSSPEHLAGEGANAENFEEVEEEPTAENKRASLFIEENFAVDELTPTKTSVPIHIAGQEVRISEFVEISEEATAPLELAQEFEESDEEVNYDYAVTKTTDGNNHVAGEVTNIELREITDEEESPESDYGEQFEEFESAYRTQGLMEPTRSAHIAGEIDNIVSRDEVMEDTLQLEEGLEFEDSLQLVTTTNIEDTNQSSLHVAVELSNTEPHEESSEEEKPEKEEIAEEIEEAEVRATTVALKSPQSLLSIAAAALELKIDTTQQVSEVVETKSEVTQQHSEEKHLEVPAIFVNVADEVSDNDEESACYVEEEPNIETEIQEQFEETVVKYKTEKKPVSESHVAAEVCISEFPSKKDDVEEQTDFAEPFEESEEGSVSELMSECSSSPLHVSSELKDFQDYETTGEDYGTETYQVMTLDETKFVSEKSFSKGLPSLYITEELSTQAIYDESVLNGKSVAIETTEEYKKEEKPLETETSIFVSQPPLQTVSDFSDSDYNDGVGEEDDLSEREFCEGFEEMEESGGRDTLSGEPTNAVSKSVLSESQVAEEEDKLVDATDNAQKSKEQELVYVHHYARDVERESIVHTEGKTKEDTKEIEEKGFTYQMQTFTTVSQREQRSVEVKSSYHVMESRESQSSEHIYTGEEEQRMEISHTIEETVQVIASKTTRQVSSTDSHIATASEEIHYKADKNSEGILKEELKTVQEISFTPTKQTTRQTSWENDQHYVKNDQLSESILEKEVEDQETKKNERLLSEDETEVRLLKSEVMKSKAAEQQESLGNPHVMIERESKFVSLVHSGVKDVREVQQVIRQEDVTVILKDDEASLEEESAEEHFEEEIDIMRMDEALSEEEFRGEGAENVEHSSSRLSKTDSVEEIDRWDQEEGSKPLEDERKKHLFEEEVDVSEVQSIYEEEVEMQRVKLKEDGDPSETKDNVVSSTPTFEEEVETAAHGSTIQAEEGSFESQTADNMQLRPQSTEFEEELEVSTLQEVQEVGLEDFDPEGHSVAAVFEEEVEISASREEYQEPMMVKDEERKTVYYIESSEQFVEEGRAKLVEKRSTRRQPLDLSQVDLYEDEGAATRYYVELSSTESLERAYEEVEDEVPFTEKFVRQGDPLEENLEEFILVRYGDEFESSGEEDLSEQREIYVIPEEDNDGENNNLVEYPKEELEIEKEPLAESFYEREYKDVGLEEIRESPEFGIDDSPEDELDEEEQRQLEEYERLESFVILEEKLSQVESDEDCDDENGGFRGEEGDENVFHSDVHSSSEETLHEDELGETMTTSSIRHAAVSADTESNEDKNTDRQSSGTHQELAEDSFVVKDDELEVQEGFAESAVKDFSSEEFQTLPIQKGILSDEGDRENVKATPESVEKEEHPESREGKDNKNEHNLSSDSSGEQSISSEGSLSSTASVDLEGERELCFSFQFDINGNFFPFTFKV